LKERKTPCFLINANHGGKLINGKQKDFFFVDFYGLNHRVVVLQMFVPLYISTF
jgi:hypothetical protein